MSIPIEDFVSCGYLYYWALSRLHTFEEVSNGRHLTLCTISHFQYSILFLKFWKVRGTYEKKFTYYNWFNITLCVDHMVYDLYGYAQACVWILTDGTTYCQCLGSLNIVPFWYMLTLLPKRYLPSIIFACTQDDMGKQLGKTCVDAY